MVLFGQEFLLWLQWISITEVSLIYVLDLFKKLNIEIFGDDLCLLLTL